jgi:HNH endonuclease
MGAWRPATPAGWTGSEPTTTPGPIPAWRPGSRWRRPGCPRPWVGPRPAAGGGPDQPGGDPAQRAALVVRDGGCRFLGCARPLAWCEAHHLVPWLDGGPTDLANLALVCRAHHRAVHEGGWRLHRDPDGRVVATPPQRPHRRPGAAA